MENIDLVNLALVPVVVGVVEALKFAGVSGKLTPIVSIVIGIFGVILFSGFTPENVLIGLVTGLSASGLYSGLKTQMVQE